MRQEYFYSRELKVTFRQYESAAQFTELESSDYVSRGTCNETALLCHCVTAKIISNRMKAKLKHHTFRITSKCKLNSGRKCQFL